MLPDSPSPPPPPPPATFPSSITTLPSNGTGGRGGAAASSSHSFSLSPSILIIAAIIAFVIAASATIHLLLRFLSRSASTSSSSLIRRLSSSSSSAASTSTAPSSDQDPKTLINSLPLFSLSSAVASVPKSSLDCAVCLSPFQPDDQLRLLPACRHAFHSSCIDAWLQSTASCPLCRASILLPPSPAPSSPPPPPPESNPSRSGSFRVEIGSVSRRRTPSEEDPLPPPPPPPPHVRSYSLGSSFEYLVEEEVEAVLASVRRRPEGSKEPSGVVGPGPPGAEVAEAAGGGGRSWLKDYVDRLASSASSSFSSLRFSGRWSHRFDAGGTGGGGGGVGVEGWDLEGNQFLEEEDNPFTAFYRWLVGV